MKKCLSNFYYIKKGFSLMEMMIVLLVISIIAAAAAPMIAKKSARSAAGANGAIGYFGIGNNFGNTDNDASIIFGTNGLPANANNAKLYLSSRGNNNPHIALGRGNIVLGILGINNNNGLTLGNRNANTGNQSVTIGSTANASGQNAIAIGNATASQANSVAIGDGATARNSNAIVIGNSAQSSDNNGIIISNNNGNPSTIRIGKPGDTILLAGQEFRTSENGTITLGNENSTVVIPGNILIDRNMFVGDISYLGYRNNNTNSTYVRWMHPDGNARSGFINSDQSHGFVATRSATEHESRSTAIENTISVGDADMIKDYLGNPDINIISDRRLKKIGKKFTSGLEELKKLDSYNFTFKNDEDKIPQVGIMAQDLQKVFPNAVWEGTDKYLRIRWDEMFYAVINAVKELDAKIATAFEQIRTNAEKVTKLQAQIDDQQKVIQELKNQNKEFEKRLVKLEKK